MHTVGDTRLTPLEGAGLLAEKYYDPHPPRLAANTKQMLADGQLLLMRIHPGVRYPMSRDQLLRRVDLEGHVVAVVGYDDDSDTFLIADPWDTERFGGEQGGLWHLRAQDLGLLQVNSSLGKLVPVGRLPIKLDVTQDGSLHHRVRATVAFTSGYPATPAIDYVDRVEASLRYSDGVTLESDRRLRCDTVAPTETPCFEWLIAVEEDLETVEIEVAVAAGVHSEDPYSWSDVIGGCAGISLKRSRTYERRATLAAS